MRRVRAALLALSLAFVIIVASTGDDIMRAVCAGLGPDHPMYDILGCPLIMNPPSPQG